MKNFFVFTKSVKYLLGICILLAVVFGVWFYKEGGYAPILTNGLEQEKTEEVEDMQPSLSGRLVHGEIAGRRPVSVVVENHPDSRPQSGLSKAEVVYEVVAEGGITRFLGIFQEDVSKIGPVRSARQYLAEIADSWGALFAHVGGSPEVLSNIERGKFQNLLDLNEFYKAEFFKRVKERKAPHNAYTSTPELYSFWKIQTEKGISPEVSSETGMANVGFDLNADNLVNFPFASGVSIDFSKPQFLVEFQYDETNKTYKRLIAGKADVDSLTNEQIAPTTVIVQETDVLPVSGDREGRMNIRTTGQGPAYVFTDGKMIEARWSRSAGSAFAYQLSVDGTSLILNPGQIWIALVQKGQVIWK